MEQASNRTHPETGMDIVGTNVIEPKLINISFATGFESAHAPLRRVCCPSILNGDRSNKYSRKISKTPGPRLPALQDLRNEALNFYRLRGQTPRGTYCTTEQKLFLTVSGQQPLRGSYLSPRVFRHEDNAWERE